MIIDRRRLGKAVRRHRVEAFLTQQQLGDMARLPRSTVSNVEQGWTLPSLPTAVAIADALGVTVDELIEEAR